MSFTILVKRAQVLPLQVLAKTIWARICPFSDALPYSIALKLLVVKSLRGSSQAFTNLMTKVNIRDDGRRKFQKFIF